SVEVFRDAGLAGEQAKLAALHLGAVLHQHCHWPPGPRDDHAASTLDLLEQSRELRLRLMNIHLLHELNLAKSGRYRHRERSATHQPVVREAAERARRAATERALYEPPCS